MSDDIHKGRTPIGLIVNERDSRITFRYAEDGALERARKRLELERVKRIERKSRRVQARELSRGLEARGLERGPR